MENFNWFYIVNINFFPLLFAFFFLWSCCSVTKSHPTLCNPMDCNTPDFPVLIISQSLLKLMSIESVMPSNHLILCRPLLLLPSIFPSIRVSSSELALLIRWPKYWSFSFNISPYSSEYSRLISFRMDWFDHLPVQGTLKNLLQHHSSKASILWCAAFSEALPGNMIMLFLKIFSSNNSLNVTFLKILARLMEKKVEDYLLEIFNMKTYLYPQIRGGNHWRNNNVIQFMGIFIKDPPISKTQQYERFHCSLSYDCNFILTVFGVCFTLYL